MATADLYRLDSNALEARTNPYSPCVVQVQALQMTLPLTKNIIEISSVKN
jgi:hypothetical protein